jgi:hypothetical protein
MNLIITDTEIQNKAEITEKIHTLVISGMVVSDAINRVMREYSNNFDTFYTSATIADVQYCIKRSTINSAVRADLIRLHDKQTILHSLDWLRYHLRRAGFKIEYKSNYKVYLHFVNIPKYNLEN